MEYGKDAESDESRKFSDQRIDSKYQCQKFYNWRKFGAISTMCSSIFFNDIWKKIIIVSISIYRFYQHLFWSQTSLILAFSINIFQWRQELIPASLAEMTVLNSESIIELARYVASRVSWFSTFWHFPGGAWQGESTISRNVRNKTNRTSTTNSEIDVRVSENVKLDCRNLNIQTSKSTVPSSKIPSHLGASRRSIGMILVRHEIEHHDILFFYFEGLIFRI